LPKEYTTKLRKEVSTNKHISSSVSSTIPGKKCFSKINSSVNYDFVYGLYDVKNFFDKVDPPDELDPGDAGFSIQEVLVGKGVNIMKGLVINFIHRLKNVFSDYNFKIPI